MRKLNARENKILIACIAVIGVYVVYNWIAKPLKAKIDIVDKEIVEYQRQVKSQLKMIQRGKSVENRYNAYLEEFKQSKRNEEVMSSVLAEIEGVAKDLDLGIFDLKPKKVQKEEFYNRFSVSLTINSEFIDIIKFLHILQMSPHSFDVDQVYFDKGSRRNSTDIKTQLELSKFFIPPQ